MHLEAGFPNPWLIRGLLPLHFEECVGLCGDTLDMLQAMFGTLDMQLEADMVFWSAYLGGFFSFFRKSNLLVPSVCDFDPSRHLCRSDFTFNTDGAILSVR
jgi:hypothetical protein